jgi:hypothetical protein
MLHVVAYSEEAALIGGPQSFVCLPDFCLGSLKNSVMTPENVLRLQRILFDHWLPAEIEDIFDKFQSCDNYSHGFLVGTTNHWIAIVGNKFTRSDSSSVIEMLYMDSRNVDILNATDEKLATIVKDYYDLKVKQGLVVDHRKFREDMYLLSLKDTLSAIDLLYPKDEGFKAY